MRREPFRPERQRFVRDPWDGRILDVRAADDPWFEAAWMRDESVIAFFRAQDRARGRARLPGFDPPDDDAAAAHARAMRRRTL